MYIFKRLGDDGVGDKLEGREHWPLRDGDGI